MRAARIGFVLGCWLGVLDGVLAVRAPMPLVDAIGSVVLAVVVDGVALAAVGATIGGLLWASRRVRRGDSAAAVSSADGSMRSRAPSVRATVVLATAAAATGLVAAVAVAAAREVELDAAAGERPSGPNILLISVDTLRADHLTPYGYAYDTSPRLTELARQGVVFENAYSHSTWTLPAHASLLTGLDPIAHGVQDDRAGLHPEIETLAERLRDRGYETVAWVGTPAHGYVGARYGLASGFDRYAHFPHAKRFRGAMLPRIIDTVLFESRDRGVGNATAQIDSVLAWLAVRSARPFFLFLHFYDVHSKTALLPYEAPGAYRELFCAPEAGRADLDGCRDGRCASDRLIDVADGRAPRPGEAELERMRCLYDGGIAFVDNEIGRLVDALDADGSGRETVVFVTSDHGEAFLEHGKPLHITLHDEITRIPLIVRGPGVAAGKRALGVVALSDIAPTILDFVEGAGSADVQGRSLVPALREWTADVDRPVLIVDDGLGGIAIRQGSKKLIVHRRGLPEDVGSLTEGRSAPSELYVLDDDAGETWNRYATDPDSARALEAALQAEATAAVALRQRLIGGERGDAVQLSDDEREALRALGYLDDRSEHGAE